MVSKMVIDRQKSAAALGAALDTHAEEASATFAHLLEPYVEDGGPIPDLKRFQGLLQSRLTTLARNLVSADEVHVSEQEQDLASREARDAAVSLLRPMFAQFRAIVEALCGVGTCARIFSVTGPTPRDPVVLQRITRRMVDRLAADDFVLPDHSASRVQIDVAAWVADLRPPLGRLEASLRQLSREGRESIDTRLAKSDAMTEYDRAYTSTARILEELFRYTGLAEKASTMRPTRRTATAADETPEPTEEPPGTEPTTPPDLFPQIAPPPPLP